MNQRGKRNRSRQTTKEEEVKEEQEIEYKLVFKSNLKTILEHFFDSEIKKK